MRLFPEGLQSEQDQIDRNSAWVKQESDYVLSKFAPTERQAGYTVQGMGGFWNYNPVTAKYIPKFDSPDEAKQFNQKFNEQFKDPKSASREEILQILRDIKEPKP